ncbi:MAG: hypothetical protein K8R88_05930 [Armatimonadetes bacterium]|nr:hypothetical protein [Armatimonadota bacterium]
MLALAALALTQVALPEMAKWPVAVPAKIGAPISYSIRRLSRKPLTGVEKLPVVYNPDYSVDVTVKGKRVHLTRPIKGYGLIRVEAIGTDGSFQYVYRGYRELDKKTNIWFRGETTSFAISGHDDIYITHYTDRNNFLGYTIKSLGAKDYPLSPEQLFQVKNGRFEFVGWGEPKGVLDHNTIVSAVGLNEHWQPGGLGFQDTSVVWVYSAGQVLSLGPSAFLGVIGKSGFTFSHSDKVGTRVGRWMNGRIAQVIMLPNGLEPVGANSAGDVLLRRGREAVDSSLFLLRGKILSKIVYKLLSAKAYSTWRWADVFDRQGQIVFNGFGEKTDSFFELRPKH